jgi:hypothetical protein
MTPAERVLADLDSTQVGFSTKRLRFWLVSAAIVGGFPCAGSLKHFMGGQRSKILTSP